MHSSGSLLKGILLVAGTSIGGGMLALPVFTGLVGFGPSLLVYFLCWVFMASTGILMLEACSWMKEDANIVTLADRLLGLPGKVIAWLLYLFLFYCLTVAYIVGCGHLFVVVFGGNLPEWAGQILFLALFAPLIFLGSRIVSHVNLYLMAGLAISYLAFVVVGVPNIRIDLLKFHDWSAIPFALPIAFTAFAYQGIVPTLYNYLGRDTHLTRRAIAIGSFIPLFIYIIWQALILGIVPPHAAGGLAEALAKGESAVEPLKNFLQNPYVYVIGQFFAFFALVTSFLGVTLGLFDFLADGLSIEKNLKGKALLTLLVFGPPLLIAVTHPGIFLFALDFAGGFGCALLLGLLPIMMVWAGRYYARLPKKDLLPGGRWALAALALFVLLELISQFIVIRFY